MKRISRETALVLVLIAALFFYEQYKLNAIKKSKLISTGTVTGLYQAGKQTMRVEYTFYTVEGVLVDGSSPEYGGHIYDCFNSIKGKSFPVVYQKDDIGNNNILIL